MPEFRYTCLTCGQIHTVELSNEQAQPQRIPGPRDAASPMLLPARVLARHKAQIRHQGWRRGEPSEIMQLREDQHDRQRVDAAETAQPSDWLPIRVALGDLRQT